MHTIAPKREEKTTNQIKPNQTKPLVLISWGPVSDSCNKDLNWIFYVRCNLPNAQPSSSIWARDQAELKSKATLPKLLREGSKKDLPVRMTVVATSTIKVPTTLKFHNLDRENQSITYFTK